MAKIIAYRRLSKDDGENGNGLGLTAQATAIKDAATRLGMYVDETFTDNGVSGAAPIAKRPGLIKAISALGSGDVLLVAKRDRLSRGDELLMGWIKKEVKRKSARIESAAGEGNGDDATAELMQRIIDAFSEYERSVIAMRTKAALGVLKADGKRYSRFAPYGQRFGAEGLEDEPDELKVIRRVVKLRGATKKWPTGMPLRKIATKLYDEGVRNREGNMLVHSKIAVIAKNAQTNSTAT